MPEPVGKLDAEANGPAGLPASFTGEEMMLTLREGRIWDITRGVVDPAHTIGEGVGFYKLAPSTAQHLRCLLEQCVAEGRDDVEYEEVFRALFKVCGFGYELVGDLPWTEIDFPDDISKADQVIWPLIQALEANAGEP